MHAAEGTEEDGGGEERKNQEVNTDKFEAGAELGAETSCWTSAEEKLISSCLVRLALMQSQR